MLQSGQTRAGYGYFRKFGLNSLVARRWDFRAALISQNHSAVRLFGRKKP
jgi:hypothetical protein